MQGLIPLILIVLVMWLLLIRPQQRRVRQHQQLVASVRAGDEVVTAGGIFGTVRGLDDETLLLEVAPGVELRVLRGAVSRRMGDDVDPDAELDELVNGAATDDVLDLSDMRAPEEASEPSPPVAPAPPVETPAPPTALSPPEATTPPPAPAPDAPSPQSPQRENPEGPA